MRRALLGMVLLIASVTSQAELSPWKLHMLNCSGCHMADGHGQPAAGIPSLPGNLSKFLHSEAGRAFLVQVPGTSQSALSNAEVAELLNWMVSHFDPDNLPRPFTPYSEDEVARLRVRKLDDVMATRAGVVRELNAHGVAVH